MRCCIAVCLLLLGSSVYGQVERLGEFGHLLAITTECADFDYERLDGYFRDRDKLDSLGDEVYTIFEPVAGDYTIYEFFADFGEVKGDGDDPAYVPIMDYGTVRVLYLKVNESREIVDGYLLAKGSEDMLISNSLFCVRTRNLQIKKEMKMSGFNFRNPYDNALRFDEGIVFMGDDFMVKYDKATAPEDVAYRLVKKVEGADFAYEGLKDFDKRALELLRQKESRISLFEPVPGDYIYYQFIADVVGEGVFVPEGEPGGYGKYFTDKLEVFESTDEYVPFLMDYERVLILKTDTRGVILDGYQFNLAMEEQPLGGYLFKVGRAGLRLRDGLKMEDLGLRVTDSDGDHRFSDDVGTVYLVPR